MSDLQNKNAPCPLGFSAQIKNSVAKVQRKNELSKKVSLYFPRLWGIPRPLWAYLLGGGQLLGRWRFGGYRHTKKFLAPLLGWCLFSLALRAASGIIQPQQGDSPLSRSFPSGYRIQPMQVQDQYQATKVGAFSNVKIPKQLCEKWHSLKICLFQKTNIYKLRY